MRQCSKCERRFAAGETVCPHDGTILSDMVSFEEQAVGKTLDGKYRIDGFLKRGGMGAVYRGTHLMLNKPVAIKLIKPELVSSTDVVQRFLREARAAARLSHPNIVTVHDLGQTADGTLYIAMELVDGSSLKEMIVSEGAWEPKRTVRLLQGIGSALALAHREGIVHRDLKPQNIMVSRDNDGNEIPKLLDFGIAKTFEPTSPALTSTGMVLGTPHYMSAEQAKGQPADQRSDLYALGVILYEMLVGRVPFDDASIPQILSPTCIPDADPMLIQARLPSTLMILPSAPPMAPPATSFFRPLCCSNLATTSADAFSMASLAIPHSSSRLRFAPIAKPPPFLTFPLAETATTRSAVVVSMSLKLILASAFVTLPPMPLKPPLVVLIANLSMPPVMMYLIPRIRPIFAAVAGRALPMWRDLAP